MLPTGARLRRSRDFQAVYRTRKSWATPCLSLHVRWEQAQAMPASGELSPIRFGFVISKKVAKRAHVRNLLKRRMREISRCHLLPRMKTARGVDLLFVARVSATGLDFAELSRDMAFLMRQGGLLREDRPASQTAAPENAR